MGQQRGTQTQNQAKTTGQPEARSTPSSQQHSEQPEDVVQEILGSRAASWLLRSELQQQDGLSEARSLHPLLRSLSQTSPRVQGKPLFGGVSQEWGSPSSAGLVIQPKLTVGAAGDKYEQEADRVAAAVVEQMHSPGVASVKDGPAVQRMGEDKDDLRMKPMPLLQREAMDDDDELRMKPLVQQVGADGGAVSADVEGEINRARGGGQPLTPELQKRMGQAMGADFSGVRVHTDRQADALNQGVGARAFTTGQDLFFKRGEYQPGSRDGQELIAHELTHVVQQSVSPVRRYEETTKSFLKLQKHEDDDLAQARSSILQRHSESKLKEQIEEGALQEKETIRAKKGGGQIYSEMHDMGRQKHITNEDRSRRKYFTHTLSGIEDTHQQNASGSSTKKLQRHFMPQPIIGKGNVPKDEKQIDEVEKLVESEGEAIKEGFREKFSEEGRPGKVEEVDALRWRVKRGTVLEKGGSAGSASKEKGIEINVRSSFFYLDGGEPNISFLRSTLIHEAMHYLSFNHAGVQDIKLPTHEGTISELHRSDPTQSLDEGITDYLSNELYNSIYGSPDSKGPGLQTTYWKSYRSIGVHATEKGLDAIADKAKSTQVNWSGHMVRIIREGKIEGLTVDDLNRAYWDGDAKAFELIANKYEDFKMAWEKAREEEVKASLPEGCIIASEWVPLIEGTIIKVANKDTPEDKVQETISRETKGHNLVPKTDPRSHMYGVDLAFREKFPDDIEILEKHYPKLARSLKDVQGAMTTSGGDVKGKNYRPNDYERMEVADGSWIEVRVKPITKIEPKAVELSKKLGMDGKIPNIVYLKSSDSMTGATPFAEYQERVQATDKNEDISGKTMSELTGIDPRSSAYFAVSALGGAYETNGKVIYLVDTDERTLLHELGHWKQDLEGYNEYTINAKLLDYHNIVMHENQYGANEGAKRKIRLNYTRRDRLKGGTQSEWAKRLRDEPEDRPQIYELMKKKATEKENAVVTEVEKELGSAVNSVTDAKTGKTEKIPLYSAQMKRYLLENMAVQYFESSKYSQ